MSPRARKTAVITGATGGIGRALCDEFTSVGYDVIAIDKCSDKSVTCTEFLHLDVAKICESESKCEKLLAPLHKIVERSGVQVLINNAAIQICAPLESISLEDWNITMATNVTAPFLLSRELARYIKNSNGSIVNIGSIHATLTKPMFISYATSKSALVGLTRALAIDLGPRVRVNAINPAATNTPMLRAGFAGDKKKLEELESKHPLGRIAEPREVAYAAIFLASQESGFISGSALNIDGGIGASLSDPDA